MLKHAKKMVIHAKMTAAGIVRHTPLDMHYPIKVHTTSATMKEQVNAGVYYQKVKAHKTKGFIRSLPHTVEPRVHHAFIEQLKLGDHISHTWFLKNARVISPDGLILLADGSILADDYLYLPLSSYRSLLWGSFDTPGKHLSEPTAVIPATTNYFHWMFEALPRIMQLREVRAFPKKVLVSASLPFQKETLAAVGITQKNIVSFSKEPTIEASSLVVPGIPEKNGNPTKEIARFLRKYFLPAKKNKKGPERIYVSRGNAKNGRIVANEKEVVAFLKKYEFVPVVMDGLTVKQQATLFNNAKVIVAPHGAALTNLVFCKKSTKVLELFSKKYVNVCYWAVSNCVDMWYSYILCAPRNKDMVVDIAKLEQALRLAGVSNYA